MASKWLVATPNRETLLGVEKYILPLAINGDRDAAVRVLLILSRAIRDSVPLTPRLSGFLADALEQVAHGGNPADAFKVRRKRGERRTETDKHISLACCVEWKKLEWKKQGLDKKIRMARHRGEDSFMRAVKKEVADEQGVSYDTVDKAWTKHGRHIEAHAGGIALIMPRGRPARLKKKRRQDRAKGGARPLLSRFF